MNRKLTPAELEQLIHRELHALPPRRAPRTLESRVLAAIEHRASVPWYHQSWSYWPAAVRATFLAALTGASAAAVAALYLVSQGASGDTLAREVGSRFQIFSQLYAAGAWVFDFGARLFASIPSLWLYGGLAVVAAFYAAFLGLGAVAYRTLYQHD
ncbi:MAG: hypothetical protein ACHQ5A_12705 [Opitutales bacterium]